MGTRLQVYARDIRAALPIVRSVRSKFIRFMLVQQDVALQETLQGARAARTGTVVRGQRRMR
jgi:hypothetical protein